MTPGYNIISRDRSPLAQRQKHIDLQAVIDYETPKDANIDQQIKSS